MMRGSGAEPRQAHNLKTRVQFPASLPRLFHRFSAWYWGSAIAAERHRVEEDAARLGGRVEWTQ